MCTVTYIPQPKLNYILTSNRDENVNRAKAMHPSFSKINGVNVLFPQDTAKGGTWIGVTNHNRTICLLNGGFEKHTPTHNYKKSRGLIVLDFLTTKNTQLLLQSINLNNIEPFTLIIIDVNEKRDLIELKWDGKVKHINFLDSNLPYIWSSCTLYSKEETNYKLKRFKEFFNTALGSNDIFKFHNYGSFAEPSLMHYNNITSPIKTISVTQIIHSDLNATMIHKDLLSNLKEQHTIQFINSHQLA